MAKRKSRTAKTATAAMTAATQDPNATTPTLTLFPPADCAAALPTNPIQHDVVFAELKKLERTIDDLPYSIVLPPRDVHKLPSNARATQRLANGAALSSASVLDLIGGVPIENARAGSVSKLKSPAI